MLLVRIWMISALMLTVTAHAEVYKWVDADGKTHFGDKAPNSAKAKTLDLPTSPRPTANAKDTSAEEIKQRQLKLLDSLNQKQEQQQKQAEKQAEKQAKTQQTCLQLRDYLRNISSGRIYSLNEKGERVYANEQEHEQEIKQAQQALDTHCR